MAKALLISALRSGEGKTLTTLGLLRLFKRRRFKIQPFKIGPDYIDPKWHEVASGVPSYNLDLFAMGKERLKRLFYTKSAGKDVIIVEGVMGLFDGNYSTFSVAKLLRIPVILVVDTFGLAETIRPLLKGPIDRLKRAGLSFALFLNRISSERHLLRVERALRGYPILGYLKSDKNLNIPSRHLGLYLPEDYSKIDTLLDYLAEHIEETINSQVLDSLEFCPNEKIIGPSFLPNIPYRTIAIAYDRAFNFYYQHLIDELAEKTNVLFFSPIEDRELPSEAEAIYLGGGYPELFAERLTNNRKMLEDIRNWVYSKMPLYAECGGFVYLCKTLSWNSRTFKLAEIFPFNVAKGSLKLGYRLVKPIEKLPLFECELVFRGHEFHYTRLIDEDSGISKCYLVKDLQGETYQEGYVTHRALGSYIHLIAFDTHKEDSTF